MNAADDWKRLDGARDKMLTSPAAYSATSPALRTPGAHSDDGVVLTCAATLTPSPVLWLWPGWLAQGKLHILAGAPGQGKTTLALSMAATITSGGCWPDGCRSPEGNVVIWSGEDDPADTLLPRLLAMGADPNRIHFITGARLGNEVLPFDPARDMTQLLARAEQIGDVRLLIVDPIVSAVTGDSHKNTEVRRAMQPLVDLGAALNCAVLGISHFSKGGAGGDPASRVVGSIAFTAVARVVLVAAKVQGEAGEDRRILARGKSNIGADDGGFEYHIGHAEPIEGIRASLITWGAQLSGSARELLAEPANDEQPKSAIDAAMTFLRDVLEGGHTPAKTVEERAADAGISKASLRRASDRLYVFKIKGMGGVWYWSLPRQRPAVQVVQGAQDDQHPQGEHVEHVDLP